MRKVTDFADTGIFLLFDSLKSTGADAVLGEVQKQKSRGLTLNVSETHSTALLQTDMPLMVALLTVIPVNSRRWAAEIIPARTIPHVDRTELV